MGKNLETAAISVVARSLLQQFPDLDLRIIREKKRSTLLHIIWEDREGDIYEIESHCPDENDHECSVYCFKQGFEDLCPGLPDAVMVARDHRLIVFIEVEDTHPLSEGKLAQYYNLWDAMEGEGWCVWLVVSDRYGLNLRKLNLWEYVGVGFDGPKVIVTADIPSISPKVYRK